jgi:acylphosphatase
MKKRVHAIIKGRVQGVFFRSEAVHQARKRGVNGWIRNLADESVEALFEGDEENVKKLLEFCKQGPPEANVTSVEVVWETYSGEFKDFKIRY